MEEMGAPKLTMNGQEQHCPESVEGEAGRSKKYEYTEYQVRSSISSNISVIILSDAFLTCSLYNFLKVFYEGKQVIIIKTAAFTFQLQCARSSRW